MQQYDVIIIGAGQAGLSLGYYLSRQGRNFLLLEKGSVPGQAWADRWDSLRLFTPARYSELPGLPFPGDPDHLPEKNEVTSYFAQYAQTHKLPIQFHTTVSAVRTCSAGYEVVTDQGTLQAAHVVVATGAFQAPAVPGFARSLPGHVHQLHSTEYRNPSSLKPGAVLVVGTGNSGVQIAEELAATREVYLSGPEPKAFPRQFLGKDLFWWGYALGLCSVTVDSRIGRKLKEKAGGDPLVGINLKEVLARTGIRRVGRVTAAEGDMVLTVEGKRLQVPNIIWCTGFRPDFSWIELPVFEAGGYPRQYRGVVAEAPGLYFLGLRRMYRADSHLLGGVGHDAEYLAGVIGK